MNVNVSEKRKLNVNKIYDHYLGRSFRRVFNHKLHYRGWFEALKKKKTKKTYFLQCQHVLYKLSKSE